MERFEDVAASAGASITPLPIGIASHTSLMRSAADRMCDKLQAAAMAPPGRVPVIEGEA